MTAAVTLTILTHQRNEDSILWLWLLEV